MRKGKGKARAEDTSHKEATRKFGKGDAKLIADMQNVNIFPTRVASSDFVWMGLQNDVEAMVEKIGFGGIYDKQYDVYPIIAREFLATCILTYNDPEEPKASEGKITFFINKKLYTLGINEVCDVYGFPHHEEIRFGAFKNASNFWNLIADSEPYISRSAKITHIRNPVIRVVAKIISNILYFKKEPGAVANDELWMLFYGVQHLLGEFVGFPPNNVNLGAILLSELVKVKSTAPKRKTKAVFCGSILTPLFHYIGIDLSKTEVVEKVRLIDSKHLINCHYFFSKSEYQFFTLSGEEKLLELPAEKYTSLDCRSNLVFDPPASLLKHVPKSGRHPRRGQPAFRATSSNANDDGDDIRSDDVQPRYLLPSDSSQFLLPDDPEPDNVAAHKQWKRDALRKNNDMLHRMWAAIAKIRPCACVSKPRVRTRRNERAATNVASSDHEEASSADDDATSADDDVEVPDDAPVREMRTKKRHDGGEGPSDRPPRRRTRPGHGESDSSA